MLEAAVVRPLSERRIAREQSSGALEQAFFGVLAALAVSGLAELLLQRIVYRVGVHIPREGAFLEAYRVATFSGDFAYRTTAVLLVLAVPLVAAGLWQRGSRLTSAVLVALSGANLLAWPLGLRAGVVAAPMLFAFGAAWIAGQALVRPRSLTTLVLVAAATALCLSQYRAAMTSAGDEPGSIALIQLVSEVALIASATLAGLAACRPRPSVGPIAAGIALTLVLLASYAREPATVAIVSLWATGVTMSLPGVLYIGAFGLFALATATWLGRRETSHLALGLALLMVAGLQPQALHHGITAFIGLVLLSASSGQWQTAPKPSEVEHGS